MPTRRLPFWLALLFPYRRVELLSPLGTEQVMRALSGAVGPPSRYPFESTGFPFEGSVTGQEFEIYRVINYRNSFRPRIRGNVTSQAAGSRISLSMALHPLTMAILAVWFGGVFSIGSVVTLAALSGSVEREPATFIPAGMLLFGWLLTIVAFGLEARIAERSLTALFEAA